MDGWVDGWVRGMHVSLRNGHAQPPTRQRTHTHLPTHTHTHPPAHPPTHTHPPTHPPTTQGLLKALAGGAGAARRSAEGARSAETTEQASGQQECSRVAAYLQCFEPSLNSSSSGRAGGDDVLKALGMQSFLEGEA